VRLPVLVWTGLLLLAAGPAPGEVFTFPSLDRTYRDVASDLGTVQEGFLTFEVTSPANTLVVTGHRLTLAPSPAGGWAAELELEVRGAADLLLRPASGGKEGVAFRDQVVVPPQRLQMAGRLAVEPASAGFRVTVLEAPPTLQVAIESQLGGQLLGFCEGLTAFLGGADCGALERALSSVAVPLPRPGTRIDVPAGVLTEEEAAGLAAFLVRGTATGALPSDSR
jgi:hypothetical protein